MLQLSFYKEISGVIVMCTDEQAAQASLCAHAQQKNVEEIVLLGIEHQSVAIDHRLGFLTAVTDPLLHRNGGKGCKFSGLAIKMFWSP